MPISFDRNVLTESFDKVFFLNPHFEFLGWAGLGWLGWLGWADWADWAAWPRLGWGLSWAACWSGLGWAGFFWLVSGAARF